MVENDIKHDDYAKDDLILDLLKDRAYIRRKELITFLKDRISEVSLNRHINALVKEGKIRILDSKELESFGIIDSDKRAVYIILIEGSDIMKHYDTVIKTLKSKSKNERESALIELELLDPIDSTPSRMVIPLFPKNLTELSIQLKSEDRDNCERIIRILKKQIEKYLIPSEIDKFQNNLIECYKRFYKTSGKNSNLFGNILFMLGIFDNPEVIELMKQDVLEEKKLDRQIRTDYNQWSLAEIIDKSKTELFEFQKKLNSEQRLLVFQIRRTASDFLIVYQEKIKPYKERLGAMKK